MTTSTPSSAFPDGVSFNDLQKLMQNVSSDNTIAPDEPLFAGKTQDEIEAIADRMIDQSLEECAHPMLHKVLALKLMNAFIIWHDKMADQAIEDGNVDHAKACIRDVGMLQAAMGIIRFVNMDDQDFTV